MKKILLPILLFSLIMAGSGCIMLLDTVWYPNKHASFNWQDGKFPCDQVYVFGTWYGKRLFYQPTGEKTKWFSVEEYLENWREK